MGRHHHLGGPPQYNPYPTPSTTHIPSMAHHEPFKSLSPIDWDSVSCHSSSGSLPSFLTTILADAQTLIDSIPEPSPADPGPNSRSGGADGRARAATDSAVGPRAHTSDGSKPGLAGRPGGDEQCAAQLRKEWKEIKVGPKENPMRMSVYKLASKDGRGAWFARRSVHREFGFERWREGLAREFEKTLRRVGEKADPAAPGVGNIRGIGAEKRVEDTFVEGTGRLQVYQLSARFPGPTTPRDFTALLLMSDGSERGHNQKRRQPRQFMVVSKPCVHPECPQRQGFIRGQYESVEVIREIPVHKPLRRVRSSIDLSRDEFARGGVPDGPSNSVCNGAMLRSASQAAASDGEEGSTTVATLGRAVSFAETPVVRQAMSDLEDEGEPKMAIEWIMITRSDPGGSVPRFMVEKGTPPGICNDAGRLVKWLSSQDFNKQDAAISPSDERQLMDVEDAPPLPERKAATVTNTSLLDHEPEQDANGGGSGGFYGMIASALGAAGSAVASRLPNSFTGSSRATDSERDDGLIEDDESDTSSTASFASAEEGEPTPMRPVPMESPSGAPDFIPSSIATKSTKSAVSDESSSQGVSSHHEKELRKLEERRCKAQERIARMQERSLTKQQDNSKEQQKDAQALAKLREKHEKELAKQEEKYQRELKRLEEKRVAEEKKAEERRRKAIEREEKANIQLELERTRAERDVARKQNEIMKEQLGELQAQNTMLVAKLGKMGVGADAWGAGTGRGKGEIWN